MPRILFMCVLLLLAPGPAAAADWRVASGSSQTTLVELFTSEGCNSCPPAEEYLNHLAQSPDLWTRYLPVAFHVDYWNYLGWRDRFSSADHSERQRRYQQAQRVGVVYTPAFIVNGREWRPDHDRRLPESGDARVGRLAITIHGKQLDARFEPVGNISSPLEMHLALLGMGLVTDIRAGENAGRHANHDFVVLKHWQLQSSTLHWQSTWPPEIDRSNARQLALVAWVSRPGDPAPLQATGGYVPDRIDEGMVQDPSAKHRASDIGAGPGQAEKGLIK
jgi:hypothetical protein